MNLAIHYSDVEEFLTELADEASTVEGLEVRLTITHKYGEVMVSMSVRASFVARGHFHYLTCRAGAYPGVGGPDAELASKANKLVERIKDRAESLGLRVRFGRALPVDCAIGEGGAL